MKNLSDICRKCSASIGECCDGIVNIISAILLFAFHGCWIDLILGFTCHFSSDWVKEHKVSIAGSPPQTMKLFEVCEDWPPRASITEECPLIDDEYAFIGMLLISVITPWLMTCLLKLIGKVDEEMEVSLVQISIIVTNLGLLISAIFFIKSGRQSGRIVGKHVRVLDGPYNLCDALKIGTGVLVILMSLFRILYIGLLLLQRVGEVHMCNCEINLTCGCDCSYCSRCCNHYVKRKSEEIPPATPPDSSRPAENPTANITKHRSFISSRVRIHPNPHPGNSGSDNPNSNNNNPAPGPRSGVALTRLPKHLP